MRSAVRPISFRQSSILPVVGWGQRATSKPFGGANWISKGFLSSSYRWRWAMMGLVFYHKNTSGCLLGAGCAGSAGCYLAWCPMSIAVCALYEWQVTTRHLSVPDRSKLRTLCTFLAPYGSNRLKLNLRFKVSQWEKYQKTKNDEEGLLQNLFFFVHQTLPMKKIWWAR